MADDRGVIRSISWRDLFPWLLLARVFRLAISVQLLFFATAGVLIAPLGWQASEAVFLRNEDRPAAGTNLGGVIRRNSQWPGSRAAAETAPLPGQVVELLAPYDGLSRTFHRLTLPVRLMFDPSLNVRQFAYLAVGNLWTLIVWAFFGAVISRVSIVHLAREERVSTRRAVIHAVKKFPAYFAAPLAMLVLVFLSAIFPAFLGLLLRADVLAPVAGVLWIIGLLCGLVMTICLLALLFGWPLMWSTIAAENSDYLDALSRSFAYTLQRPLAYLFYAIVAAILGGLGWIVVYWFAEMVIWLTLWGASWGMGHTRTLEFAEYLEYSRPRLGEEPAEPTGLLALGVALLKYDHALVRSIAVAYLYSFFWGASAGIYLLLRRDVDQKEIDEVYLEDEEEANTLPPLPVDAAGVAGAPESDLPPPEPPPTSTASQGTQPE